VAIGIRCKRVRAAAGHGPEDAQDLTQAFSAICSAGISSTAWARRRRGSVRSSDLSEAIF